jgi:hypothetical protein
MKIAENVVIAECHDEKWVLKNMREALNNGDDAMTG